MGKVTENIDFKQFSYFDGKPFKHIHIKNIFTFKMTLTKLSVRPQSPDVITQTVSDNFVGPARVVRRESRV